MSMQGGEPRRLTNLSTGQLSGVAWTPDGRDLIYSNGRLWRIAADTASPNRGSLLAEIPGPADHPSISHATAGQPARLSFQASTTFQAFQMIDLTAPSYQGRFRSGKPFVAPSNFSYPGAFSPDGSRFAFVSGPPPQLWASPSDGTSPRRITSMEASHLSSGSWSPAGWSSNRLRCRRGRQHRYLRCRFRWRANEAVNL